MSHLLQVIQIIVLRLILMWLILKTSTTSEAAIVILPPETTPTTTESIHIPTLDLSTSTIEPLDANATNTGDSSY